MIADSTNTDMKALNSVIREDLEKIIKKQKLLKLQRMRLEVHLSRTEPKRVRPQTLAQSLASHRNWMLYTAKGIEGQIHCLERSVIEMDCCKEVYPTIVQIETLLQTVTDLLLVKYDKELLKLKTTTSK